ncbi:hypothetical protein E1A91_A01G106300v1 [Gossypium mustelinum]|uniref:Uncharacterized protein n=1 Tax=Gossypium mustelinum TaxID=34275 RepID=A0A5D3AGQ7_GOSMU|nr:hypothetical protein E1A91_A01G106300v1 [Gossypium mustelinum]
MVSTGTIDYSVLSDLPSYDLQALLNNKGNEENINQLENLSLSNILVSISVFLSKSKGKGPDNSFFQNLLMEEPGFKIGRYNPEERQERISNYRAKRNQRNFN